MKIEDVVDGIYAWHGQKRGAVTHLHRETGIAKGRLYDFVNKKTNISTAVLFRILETIEVEPTLARLSTDNITEALTSDNPEQALRDLGFSLTQIGEITGVTRQRVHQRTNP